MKHYLENLQVNEKSIDGWLGFERMQSQGFVSVVTDDIERLTGKKPLSMQELLDQHKNK